MLSLQTEEVIVINVQGERGELFMWLTPVMEGHITFLHNV